ncbi:MAG: LuxR family transcriptional regulator [Devosia sp.]
MTSLEGILSDIGELTAADQIAPFMARLTANYGLQTAAYLGTGTLDRQREPREPYLAVTYSPDWVERYRTQGYLKIDPVVRIGLKRLLPFDWSEFTETDKSVNQLFGEAAEFGLGPKGISFPIHGHAGDKALLSVSADLSELDWKGVRRTILQQFPIIAAHLHEAVLRTESATRPIPRLSPRELECLQWSSEGKTVWECSVILGLSQHTVRCYLESARHKLAASSNAHAVSIALRSGLLFEHP